MQVVEAAEHVKASKHEQCTGDAERHQGATTSNDFLRKVQLILRHGFAFPYFMNNRFGAAYLFAYRSSRSVLQPFHVYSSKGGEYQRQSKGNYGQITK